MKCRILAALLVLALNSTSLSAAGPTVNLGQPATEGGGTAVNPGDVYGIADFEFLAPEGISVEEAIGGLVKAVIGSSYGNKDGSYLLTLELLRNNEPIVQKPLVTVTYKSESFLFWTVSSTLSRGVTFNGILLKTEPIDDGNNDVEIALRSYYKNDSSFDMSLFDLFDQVSTSVNLVEALDPSGVASSLYGSIKKIIAKSLQNSTKIEDHFRLGMAFAQVGGVNNSRIRIAKLPIKFRFKNNSSGSLSLQVKTWSVSSRFLFDPATKKFVDPVARPYSTTRRSRSIPRRSAYSIFSPRTATTGYGNSWRPFIPMPASMETSRPSAPSCSRPSADTSAIVILWHCSGHRSANNATTSRGRRVASASNNEKTNSKISDFR